MRTYRELSRPEIIAKLATVLECEPAKLVSCERQPRAALALTDCAQCNAALINYELTCEKSREEKLAPSCEPLHLAEPAETGYRY